MSKTTETTTTETPTKQTYCFPELGVTVEAESLEIATEIAKTK